MDVENGTAEAFTALLKSTNQLELFGSLLDQNVDRCPFVERGSLSVRWDGKVSPCLPLLYTHSYFLDDRERCSHAHFVGDLTTRTLLEIWNDPSYLDLRDRLQSFDFSPCTYCNSCEIANDNLEDCYGNTIPACGGCLWAQGLIRCP
jgi:MoaA/NifB/PqqE/SkfB family radical SAM enzyme